MQTLSNKNHKGFTLVELLVVISIIAILSSIGAVIYSSTQKSARMAQRAENLKAIATALEAYKTDKGSYPCLGGSCPNLDLLGWRSVCTTWNRGGAVTTDTQIPGLVPTYLQNMPVDPQQNLGGTSCFRYTSNSAGSYYKVVLSSINEFTDSDYRARKDLLDPVRDGDNTGGGNDPLACTFENLSSGAYGWAVYDTNPTLSGRCL